MTLFGAQSDGKSTTVYSLITEPEGLLKIQHTDMPLSYTILEFLVSSFSDFYIELDVEMTIILQMYVYICFGYPYWSLKLFALRKIT